MSDKKVVKKNKKSKVKEKAIAKKTDKPKMNTKAESKLKTEELAEKMNSETRLHYVEMLTTVYQLDEKQVNAMSDEMLIATVRAQEKKEISKARNPNAFWMFRGLPTPKLIKPTTSSKAGMWVILTLVAALLIFLAVALLYVFLK